MRIRLWNAYASNNSGSYTIVGRFEQPEQAAAVVTELQPLIDAQHAWERRHASAVVEPAEPAPITAFAAKHGLRTEVGYQWPEPESFGEDKPPQILQLGRQVLVHHPFTLALTRFFGQWFYHRGGRVETELDHAHNPVIATFSCNYDLNDPARNQKAEALFVALGAKEGPLARHSDPDVAPVLRCSDSYPQVFVAVVFADLVAGTQAVREVLAREGSPSTELRVFESPRDTKDEGNTPLLAFLA